MCPSSLSWSVHSCLGTVFAVSPCSEGTNLNMTHTHKSKGHHEVSPCIINEPNQINNLTKRLMELDWRFDDSLGAIDQLGWTGVVKEETEVSSGHSLGKVNIRLLIIV